MHNIGAGAPKGSPTQTREIFPRTVGEAASPYQGEMARRARGDRACPSVVLRTVYSIKNWLSFPVRLPFKVGAEHPERNSVRVKAARAPR